MKRILFLFGTRPEAIKMAPLIHTFKNDKNYCVKVGVTAQHREMLDQVIRFFNIEVDYDLNIMRPNQTLPQLTSDLITKITNEILLKESFDYVFVQGDTTTVLASSLAAFYQKIKVIHIEAGLRSHDIYSPFPEEMNRLLTSRIANIHFCPTPLAEKNLQEENCNENVFVVGNTVIDALFMGLEKIKNEGFENKLLEKYDFIDFSKKIILVTCHRRENFGEPFNEICDALLEIAAKEKNTVEIIFPVHLNPNILEIAHKKLIASNIKLITPLEYPELIWIMNKSYLIITDSGGIQEEAPSLGKPVIVMRNVTERTEGVESGNAVLVGHDCKLIVEKTIGLLNKTEYYDLMTSVQNPYGDGTTSTKIKNILTFF